ncbi:MAG: M23 family metallopeptidase [Anaerolineales bacterium]|nr:M23 family metallopeptidase [Anaerolineales bacterium]
MRRASANSPVPTLRFLLCFTTSILVILFSAAPRIVLAQTDGSFHFEAAIIESKSEGFVGYELNSSELADSWGYLTFVQFAGAENSRISGFQIALAEYNHSIAQWQIYPEGTMPYDAALAKVPDWLQWLALLESQRSDPSDSGLGGTYEIPGLPWKPNTSWRYNQGPAEPDHPNEFDFGTPVRGVPENVYAAESGTVVGNSGTCMWVQRPSDGLRLFYQHIASTDIANYTNGTPITYSQNLGKTTISPGCGGTSTGHHVHFSFYQPNGGGILDPQGFILNGWEVVGNTLVKDGETVPANFTDTILHSMLENLEEITIPANGNTVYTTISLEAEIHYSVTISGTFRYDAGDPFDFADAQYHTQNNISWNRGNWVAFNGIRLDANNRDLDNHVHKFFITGKGQPLSLRIIDTNYGDNSGQLVAIVSKCAADECRDPFANNVIGYQALGAGNQHTDPATVLGPPSCGTFDLSLGGGWVVVDMGEDEEIADGDGEDFRVYESDPNCSGGGASAYAVFVSNSSDGPWVPVGNGNGVSSFDLSSTGLISARYVRIEDRAPASPPATPGADIDAIEAIHVTDEEAEFLLSLPFDSGINQHYDLINSIFDHNYPGDGTTTPQPPDFEIVTYAGDVARQNNAPCTDESGQNLPVYRTDTGVCVYYDGHNGIDFDLAVGDEIRPAADGTIINITTNFNPPSLVVIEHQFGNETYRTWYGHIAPDPDVQQAWINSSPNPSQRRLDVFTSTVIGRVTSQAGHLHFTVIHNGKYTDPYGWLLPTPDPLSLPPYNGEPSHCLWVFGCGIGVAPDVTTGGAIRSVAGDIFVSVPPLAYSEPITYHLASLPTYNAGNFTRTANMLVFPSNNGLFLASAAHTFTLKATKSNGDVVSTLMAPVGLRVAYDELDLMNIDVETLGLYQWDEQSWTWLEISDVNQAYSGYITGETTELGYFAILGQAKYVQYLPLLVVR